MTTNRKKYGINISQTISKHFSKIEVLFSYYQVKQNKSGGNVNGSNSSKEWEKGYGDFSYIMFNRVGGTDCADSKRNQTDKTQCRKLNEGENGGWK